MSAIRFASAASREREPRALAAELAGALRAQLGERRPDLALVFLSGFTGQAAVEAAETIATVLDARVLLGCTAEGVITRDEEIEREPAATAMAACLPGLELAPVAFSPVEWRDLLTGDALAFRARLTAPHAPRVFLVLADPFTTPVDELLDAFDRTYPGVPVMGGMASGASRPGGNLLFLSDDRLQLMTGGALCLGIGGALAVDVVVSQGCRPIGRPFTVTAAQGNVILTLEGCPPLAQVRALVDELSAADQALLRNGLFIGRAIDPQQEELGRGDFLIRAVMGANAENGAIAVGDRVTEGQRVQFHVRDAVTAAEDLELMLAPQAFGDPPAGALLFSCNGRGTRLYDHPDGDVRVLNRALGVVPLAGLFCAGEIGPIAGRSFMHGHTASLVLFRAA